MVKAKEKKAAKQPKEAPVDAPRQDQAQATQGRDAFRVPNITVATFVRLLNIPLHGQQSRARNRLVKRLVARGNWLYNERTKILEKYAERNKDGSLKKPEAGARAYDGSPITHVILPERQKEADNEWISLGDSPFEMELDADTKRDLVAIRPLILESKVALDTNSGEDYDRICEAFEAI